MGCYKLMTNLFDEDKWDDYLVQARNLHNDNTVVFAHLDLAPEIYYRNQLGQTNIVRDYYLEDFKEAGANVVVSSLYMADLFMPELALKMALCFYDALCIDLESVKDEVFLVRSKAELNETVADGKIAILLSFEGAEPLVNKVSLLRPFFQLGIRGLGITWSRRNYFADGCCGGDGCIDHKGGVTNLGKELIYMAEDIGMWIDVSHINDNGFDDMLEIAQKPFIASHSNVRSLYMSSRNLTDRQLSKLALQGGIIGINAYKNMICGEMCVGPYGIEKLCDHIEYVMNYVGASHVGLGLDLCNRYFEVEPGIGEPRIGGDSINSHAEALYITAILLARRVSKGNIINLIGGNFFNYFNLILK